MPGWPGCCLASKRKYILSTEPLVHADTADAANDSSQHDCGRDILPATGSAGRAYAYVFALNEVPGQEERERGYWRDVGTVGAYWQANMDLVAVHPVFDLYNPRWPIHTWAT